MTLAFNLGIFFRNLHGEPVRFSARNNHAELRFEGGVSALSEQVDLTRELRVSLVAYPLRLELVFEEPEDEQASEEDLRVLVTLHRMEGEGAEAAGKTNVTPPGERPALILQTEFRFGEISLTPLTQEAPGDSAARHPGAPPLT